LMTFLLQEDEEVVAESSKSYHTTFHISKDSSHKLLLASVLKNNNITMTFFWTPRCKNAPLRVQNSWNGKIQYDSNPSGRRCLLKFFWQSIGKCFEKHGIFSRHSTRSHWSTKQSVLHVGVNLHQRQFQDGHQAESTNRFGDKVILTLQAQCASFTSFEKKKTHRDFTGMHIASWESLSSYLHCISMAWDKAENAGNDYDDDALVDLFISSLWSKCTDYYSAQWCTLENRYVDGNSIPFVDMVQKFILLEEHHALRGSSHHESANSASLTPNPLAASNNHNGTLKPKRWQ
jgi:hypothetical protein